MNKVGNLMRRKHVKGVACVGGGGGVKLSRGGGRLTGAANVTGFNPVA